jgi:hypothetical protein
MLSARRLVETYDSIAEPGRYGMTGLFRSVDSGIIGVAWAAAHEVILAPKASRRSSPAVRVGMEFRTDGLKDKED